MPDLTKFNNELILTAENLDVASSLGLSISYYKNLITRTKELVNNNTLTINPLDILYDINLEITLATISYLEAATLKFKISDNKTALENKILKVLNIVNKFCFPKDIISKIYQITLIFILKEIKFYNSSSLLELLKNDVIHEFYLNYQITLELSKLDLSNPEYQTVLEKSSSLKENHASYLNLELLSLLAVSHIASLIETREKLNDMTSKINHNALKKDHLKEQLEAFKSSLGDFKKTRKRLFQSIGLFATSVSILIGLGYGGHSLNKKLATKPSYNCTTTIYTENKDPFITSDYTRNIANKMVLYYYEPYYDDNGTFKRDVTYYNLGVPIPNLTLQDALEINPTALSSVMEKITCIKKDFSLNDLYDEPFYELQIITTDINDTKSELDTEVLKKLNIILAVGLIALEFGADIFGILQMIQHNDPKRFSLGMLFSLMHIYDSCIEFSLNKKDIANLKNQIAELSCEVETISLKESDLLKNAHLTLKETAYLEELTLEREKLAAAISLCRKK